MMYVEVAIKFNTGDVKEFEGTVEEVADMADMGDEEIEKLLDGEEKFVDESGNTFYVVSVETI